MYLYSKPNSAFISQVEDRRPSVVIGLKGEMPLEAQLQVEREATDRKEKEVPCLLYNLKVEMNTIHIHQLPMTLQGLLESRILWWFVADPVNSRIPRK